MQWHTLLAVSDVLLLVVLLRPPLPVHSPQVDVGEEEPIIEIPVDPFLDSVMTAWIETQKEGYEHLDATFHKYDENGDGMLSLKEFTGVKCIVQAARSAALQRLKLMSGWHCRRHCYGG